MDLPELSKHLSESGVTVTSTQTAFGESEVFNGKVAVLKDPDASSSQELRDEQLRFKLEGIDLFYVYAWDGDLTRLETHLRSKLNLDSRSYSARRLTLKVIENKLADKFLRENHIQGSARGVGKVSLGLLKDDELLGIQQFSRYRFSNLRGKDSVTNSPVWEGLRLCFKSGVQIHGGASRFQKFFEEHYSPQKIISYVNLSHSTGDYKNSQGFKDITAKKQSSYMWVLEKGPHNITIIDKNGDERVPDLAKVSQTPYISPTKIAGAFGKGVGQTFFGAKLGSRSQLRAYPENGELVHNDAILEAIGYRKKYMSGQAKWEKDFTE